MTGSGRLVVLAPLELEGGFLLAGVDVRAVADHEEAEVALGALIREGAHGVIAVYEPYLASASSRLQRRAERSVDPLVIALPAGTGPGGAADRRSRLLARLQRAIGYHITFGDES